MILKILFWFFFGTILYTYFGYTILLIFSAIFKRIFSIDKPALSEIFEPEATLLIPSYNEEKFVIRKVENSLNLDYPKNKLKIIWITDGSTDNTCSLLNEYPQITVLHENERRGKIHAMNRGMKVVTTPFIIFTDANSMLNKEAVREIVKRFSDDRIGCVAGEKRITESGRQKAVGAGEGLYWKYESLIKRLESETGSVVGAVGEIFAVRSILYEDVKEDTLLDDFTLSLQVIRKGYAVKYAPGAWGTETASISVNEEIKRKIRIATGGIQSLVGMPDLLNPFKYGFLTLKYLSHKVLRWTIVPFSFPIFFLVNLAILIRRAPEPVYVYIFALQLVFYMMVLAGKLMENIRMSLGILFAPYYLFIMNLAVIKGFFRYFTGNYSVKWQKANRN